MYFFSNYNDLIGMEAFNENNKEKRIYRFSFTNNCIKQVGDDSGEVLKLSNTGRKLLKCDLSIWQKYIVGIPKIEFAINLDKDCIADASMIFHQTKKCLPAYPSPTNLKDVLLASYFLFPDNAKNDLAEIYEMVNSFERYLFTFQKLSLRESILTSFDSMVTHYAQNKDQCSMHVKHFLEHILGTINSTYKNSLFLYKGLFFYEFYNWLLFFHVNIFCLDNIL
ncbi:MAG TPA: hypothetical protein VL201_01945 [Patescibacteria group bacterium]|nr:hypothetical protein [Patescibacteria group bacterium]